MINQDAIDFGEKVLNILGIENNRVISFEIHCSVDYGLTFTVKMYIDTKKDSLVDIFKKYKLVKIE